MNTKFYTLIEDYPPHKPARYDITSCFWLAFIKVWKRPKMLRPTALFALNLMQCQRHLQIIQVKNIGNVFELSSVAFRLRLASLYGGLFVIFEKSFVCNCTKLVSLGIVSVTPLCNSFCVDFVFYLLMISVNRETWLFQLTFGWLCFSWMKLCFMLNPSGKIPVRRSYSFQVNVFEIPVSYSFIQ